jgi:hypothetical protein
MLPHTAFDDHHIFGLGYRKPIPDSPMVTNFTSWEPASTGRDLTADEAWRQRHSPGIENEIKAIKKRYRIAITVLNNPMSWNLRERFDRFQESGMAAFEDMAFENFLQLSPDQKIDLVCQEARSTEFAHCGFMRHQRKCNECRYQRGELSNRSRPMGSLKTPVVRGRILRCESQADRYLPGLARCLGIKNQFLDQPSFAISPADIDDHVEYLTTYMIRCSACSTWKESHEFQPGEDWSPMYLLETSLHHTDMMAEEPGAQETTHHEFQQWAHTPKDPKMYDDLRCNNCFVQVYSRQELYKLYMPLLEYHIERQKLRLVDGVYVKVRGLTNWCPTKWIHEVTNITKGFDNIRYCRYSPEFKSMGILSCYKASIKFLNRTKNAGKKHNCRNWHGLEGQVDGLQKDYDHRLVQMEWIKGIIPRVKEPDIVEKMIEWALSDTTRLLYF